MNRRNEGMTGSTATGTDGYVRNLSRRDFVKGTLAVAGGGLILGVFPGCADDVAPAVDAGISGAVGATRSAGAGGFEPNVWVRLLTSGDVEITCARSEMGQGVRATMAYLVADEMEADWARVRVIQAVGDAKYGNQNTDGSTSVLLFYDSLRKAGATARRMLEQAAADTWGVPVAECRAANHVVTHQGSGRSATFAELVEAASVLDVPENVTLKDAPEFRYIGKKVATLDNQAFVTGQATFGADVSVPGMRYAAIQRSPTVGGSVRSYDAAEARAFPGVTGIVDIPALSFPVLFQPIGGVAVVAENSWAAMEGRKRLNISWNPGPNGTHESVAYRAELEASASRAGRITRDDGDADAALDAATRKVEASYYVPYLAHAPMEPPACVAVVEADRCEVWAPTQDPQTARTMVAGALGLTEDQVTVNVTLLGGGFGRKSKPDYVVEAALVAKATGTPIKLQWSREDEIRHGYYHAVSAQRIEAAVDENGMPTAWRHRTAFPSIFTTFAPGITGPVDQEIGLGAFTVPFDVPNVRVEACDAPNHVRIGWFRSVSNIHHSFAVNCFADELAHEAGRDPREYLLDLIGPPRVLDLYDGGQSSYGVDTTVYKYDTGRLRAVLERAATEANWGGPLPEGHARGLAAHYSFNTYVAHVVEASVDGNGRIRVHRVDVAIDSGRAVNPDRVRSQMEGSVIMGMSLALFGEITVRDGAVVQGNYDDYPILRLPETPDIHVHIIEGDPALPTGVGEPGMPPLAPALANAVFAATGRRLREMPLRI